MEKKTPSEAIFFAILSTLLWGGVYFGLAYFEIVPFYIAFLLLFGHPFIGKFWSLLIELLCTVIDELYDLKSDERWGDWPLWGRILFAAWWPIAGPIGLVVTIIGVLYGITYKLLFK